MFLVQITLASGQRIIREAKDLGEANTIGYEACTRGVYQTFSDGFIRCPPTGVLEVRCAPKAEEEVKSDTQAQEAPKAPAKRKAVSKRKTVAKKSAPK